ncbi:hypothetical protein F4677DRAFT_451485 [Hypoxylon crocopeplum]|nr:hypothetical protein F4677DRAFT_451485 [Hypoxylon crocopeplum]
MTSLIKNRITVSDREQLEFIRQLHQKEPTLTADQLIQRLEAENGRLPSKMVLRAIHLHVDPYKECREVIDSCLYNIPACVGQ